MLKKFLKRQSQILAARVGKHRWAFQKNQLLILMYHRILPSQDPRVAIEQPGMVVHPETFRMHLRLLKDHFTFIHLSDWIRRARDGRPVPPRSCVITFDDGWRDNYEFAFPIIQEEQVRVTIYVVSDTIGTDRKFWPERLALVLKHISRLNAGEIRYAPPFHWLNSLDIVLSDGQLDREKLDRIICRAKAFSDRELHERIDEMVAFLGDDNQPGPRSILDWEQVREMINSGLVNIGSHTSNHTRLIPGIDGSALYTEIVGSKQTILEQTGHAADTFCFPNGDRIPEATALVRKTYHSACTTSRGWNSIGSDHFTLRRIGVHQDIAWDETSFLARVSGWV